MRLLRRRVSRHTRIDRPAAPYVAAGAEEARRRGHGYVGTEHVLLALTRNPESGAARVLRELGVTHRDIEASPIFAGLWGPRIDAEALAALGIDLDAVRDRLDEAFGPGALEHTNAGMLEPTTAGIQCIAPRLKQSLENALERAAEGPVRDEHVLLGMLSVPDSLAARALADLGVSLPAAEALVHGERP